MSLPHKSKQKKLTEENKSFSLTYQTLKENIILRFLKRTYLLFFQIFCQIGFAVIQLWSSVFKSLVRRVKRPFKRLHKKGTIHLKSTLYTSHFHFKRVKNGLSLTLSRTKALLKELKEINGFKNKCSRMKRGFSNGKSPICKILNHVVPVLSLFIFGIIVYSFVSTDYAIALEQNNQVIAYVDNSATYEKAREQIEGQLVYNDSEQTQQDMAALEQLKPSFSLSQVKDDGQLSNENELSNTLLEQSSADIQPATGLYIDGQFYGAVTDKTSIENDLNQILSDYTMQTQTVNPTFMNDVVLQDGIYFTSSIESQDEMNDLLHSNTQEQKVYQVQDGDTLNSIAEKNGISYDQIKALNPGLVDESIMPGQTLLMSNSQPLLDVAGTKEIQYEEAVPYEQLSQEDPNLDVGTSVVTQQGQEGKNLVTADLQVVNGAEASRTVINSQQLQPAVPQITNVGTKAPSYNNPTNASRGSGKKISMIRPLNTGYISCDYSSSHGAVDIAAPRGTAIHAAASGKVILANWYSSYGQCVIVDHGDGIQTLYAHMSQINVSVGQSVAQGQTLGLVGSTGNSTGNHLHFEVRVNGTKQDPKKYVDF